MVFVPSLDLRHVGQGHEVTVRLEAGRLEERIMACADPTLLATWLQRVATVASAAELLAGGQ